MTDRRFQQWVKNYGDFDRVAHRLGVTRSVVRAWYYGCGWPKTANIIELIKLSNKELTFEDIVRDTSYRMRSEESRPITAKKTVRNKGQSKTC